MLIVIFKRILNWHLCAFSCHPTPFSYSTHNNKKKTISGVITTSPLRIEVELQPVPTVQWHMIYTFLYLNKITFTGSRIHQEINFDILR